MQKITVVGGFGFIGQNICERLSNSYNINIVGRNSSQKKLDYPVQSYEVDVENSKEIAEISNNGHVIWLATSLYPSKDGGSVAEDFERNTAPVINFLEYCKLHQIEIKKFIFFSSGGTIYGEPEIYSPIIEVARKAPISSYGLSKLVTENYIQYLTNNSLFESVILRPSNVYGKYQNLAKPQGIIGFALKAAQMQDKLVLFDGGKVIRDFVHVNDICTLLDLILKKEVTVGESNVYNVGSSQGYTIKQVIDKVSSVTEYDFELVNKEARGFDCGYNVLNIEAIKNMISWEPQVSLEVGIEDTWKWMRK